MIKNGTEPVQGGTEIRITVIKKENGLNSQFLEHQIYYVGSSQALHP